MSVETLAVVLNHSTATGTDKVVLIGIANHDGDGGAWPSIATLMKYANVTERNVQRAIERLVGMGELAVDVKGGGQRDGRYRTNRYRVLVSCPRDCDGSRNHRSRGGADDTPENPEVALAPVRGGASARPEVAPPPPEPFLQPSIEPSSSSPVDNHDDDDIETALVAAKIVAHQPTNLRGFGIVAANNLAAGGPDHDQVLAVRALLEQGWDLPAAAAEIVTPTPAPPAVVSLEERQIRSHVAALVLAEGASAARDWITADCSPALRHVAETELARHTRSAS